MNFLIVLVIICFSAIFVNAGFIHYDRIKSGNFCTKHEYFSVTQQKCLPIQGGGEKIHQDHSIRCPKSFSGLIPINKKYYVFCDENSATIMKCPKDMAYSAEVKKCVKSNKPTELQTIKLYDQRIFPGLTNCTKEGSFFIPNDLVHFYFCHQYKDHFIQKVHKCPNDLKYCPVMKICTPSPILEPHLMKPKPCEFDPFVDCKVAGQFRTSADCSKYYICIPSNEKGKFTQIPLNCPTGQLYDIHQEKCLDAKNVDCRYIPTADLIDLHISQNSKHTQLQNIFDEMLKKYLANDNSLKSPQILPDNKDVIEKPSAKIEENINISINIKEDENVKIDEEVLSIGDTKTPDQLKIEDKDVTKTKNEDVIKEVLPLGDDTIDTYPDLPKTEVADINKSENEEVVKEVLPINDDKIDVNPDIPDLPKIEVEDLIETKNEEVIKEVLPIIDDKTDPDLPKIEVKDVMKTENKEVVKVVLAINDDKIDVNPHISDLPKIEVEDVIETNNEEVIKEVLPIIDDNTNPDLPKIEVEDVIETKNEETIKEVLPIIDDKIDSDLNLPKIEVEDVMKTENKEVVKEVSAINDDKIDVNPDIPDLPKIKVEDVIETKNEEVIKEVLPIIDDKTDADPDLLKIEVEDTVKTENKEVVKEVFPISDDKTDPDLPKMEIEDVVKTENEEVIKEVLAITDDKIDADPDPDLTKIEVKTENKEIVKEILPISDDKILANPDATDLPKIELEKIVKSDNVEVVKEILPINDEKIGHMPDMPLKLLPITDDEIKKTSYEAETKPLLEMESQLVNEMAEINGVEKVPSVIDVIPPQENETTDNGKGSNSVEIKVEKIVRRSNEIIEEKRITISQISQEAPDPENVDVKSAKKSVSTKRKEMKRSKEVRPISIENIQNVDKKIEAISAEHTEKVEKIKPISGENIKEVGTNTDPSHIHGIGMSAETTLDKFLKILHVLYNTRHGSNEVSSEQMQMLSDLTHQQGITSHVDSDNGFMILKVPVPKNNEETLPTDALKEENVEVNENKSMDEVMETVMERLIHGQGSNPNSKDMESIEKAMKELKHIMKEDRENEHKKSKEILQISTESEKQSNDKKNEEFLESVEKILMKELSEKQSTDVESEKQP